MTLTETLTDATQPSSAPMMTMQTARRATRPVWEKSALVAILALATLLDFWNLRQNVFGNNYYATAVRSMMLSWHNAYYAAFDARGFLSIDKPPLGFWLQVVSAKLFGFSGFSLMLPEAIAGVVSVGLLYAIVRRAFGPLAALLAALALAISPISVVTNRDNIVDGLLVMTTLLATWLLLRATAQGNWWLLLACAACVGLGFNIKMMAAYMVVPAFAAVYLCSAPRPWRVRIGQLAVAGLVMLTVSFAWAISVDLTPSAARPYVDSTQYDSEIELIIGYNGVERFSGHPFIPAPPPVERHPAPPRGVQPSLRTTGATPPAPATKHVAPSPPPAPGEMGYPGPLRFFQPLLGGQVSWFLPLALLSMLLALTYLRPRMVLRSWRGQHLGPRRQQWLLWSIWFATMLAFFSFAHFVSAYYLVLYMPAVCALAGIGLEMFWQTYRGATWRGWFLPVGLVMVAIQQAVIVTAYPSWLPWVGPFVVENSLLLAVMLAVLRGVRLAPAGWLFVPAPAARHMPRLVQMTVALALLGVVVAPAAWTLDSLRPINEGAHPLSGPTRAGGFSPFPYTAQGFVRYLLSHNSHSAHFIMGTVNTTAAESISLVTGSAVMVMGGYGGSDPILTTQDLARMVAAHTIRFFFLPVSNLSTQEMAHLFPNVKHFQTMYTSSLAAWVGQHCMVVPPAALQASPSQRLIPEAFQLFDCSTPPALH